MYNPVSTYRIQFHKGFTFADLEQIIPYLIQLGISTIYASPIFKAVPGSTHGYDGVDPLTINAEIGTEEQLRSINQKLKEAGIGWMQDIVPNHMAFHPGNAWLMDVLENGTASEYAVFFDINYDEKLMVPFLDGTLDEVLSKGELKVAEQDNKLVLQYYENSFPLAPTSYNHNEKAEAINSDPERLRTLVDAQHYRLCHWQETDKAINYRRFFTINGLICLNIQNEKVFDLFHKKIKQFVDEGIFNGLRIDHIDGLANPTQYLENLRQLVGDDVPIVVEKILEPGESLPANWPVQGNTGYDFLSLVNNLFTNRKAEKTFTRFYQKLVKSNSSIQRQIHEKKAYILFEHMGGELENLYKLFTALQLVEEEKTTLAGKENIKKAIVKKLVELHNSAIYVESSTEGSVFFFELTLKRSGSADDIPAKRLDELKGKTVLLAEDNMVNAMVAIKLLSRWGLVTEHAKNGIEAIERSKNKTFDLILMDIHMPEMNGFDAAEHIREMDNPNMKTPIFAFTADITAEQQQEYQTYFDGFLRKPIEIDKLYDTLNLTG